MSAPPPPKASPHDRFVESLEAAGWVVDDRTSVAASGGPNPTRLDIRHAQDRRSFLVYAWFITHEGKGRAGNDYRIQTTRAHDGSLMSEPGRTTIGVGWDDGRGVFAAFDGWTKRETGRSSSVHIKRDTLDAAAQTGWAEEGPRWDARAAFAPTTIGRFLTWVGQMSARREVPLCPLEFTEIDEDTAEIVGDIWGKQPTGFVRAGDRLIVTNKQGQLHDTRLWQVEALSPQKAPPTPSGSYNRTRVRFHCRRIGKIHDPSVVDLLT